MAIYEIDVMINPAKTYLFELRPTEIKSMTTMLVSVTF